MQWISALRAPQIQALVRAGSLQLSLFDRRNLVEILDPACAGERLVVCKNPLLVTERARKREDLLAATEAKLVPLRERVRSGKLRGQDAIGLAVGTLIDRHKVGKHFLVEIGEDRLKVERKQDQIAAEAALDGIYVLSTSASSEQLDSAQVVRSYKLLVRLERGFRSFKSLDLQVQPIRHYAEPRVRAHVFLCMLAHYVQWHLERAWARCCSGTSSRRWPSIQSRQRSVQPRLCARLAAGNWRTAPPPTACARCSPPWPPCSLTRRLSPPLRGGCSSSVSVLVPAIRWQDGRAAKKRRRCRHRWPPRHRTPPRDHLGIGLQALDDC